MSDTLAPVHDAKARPAVVRGAAATWAVAVELRQLEPQLRLPVLVLVEGRHSEET